MLGTLSVVALCQEIILGQSTTPLTHRIVLPTYHGFCSPACVAMIRGRTTVNETHDLLLPREVAAMLRLKVNSVYAAAAAGRLPAVRIWRGRRKSLLRFRRHDIEELIRRGSPPQSLEG